MATNILELTEFVVKSLVEKPDEVKVVEKSAERGQVIEISVAQSDMGKVIGKQGRIAKAIRTVVKAAATRDDSRYTVDII